MDEYLETDECADTDEWLEMDVDDEGMSSCCLGNMVLIINTRGAVGTAKGAYPARFGLYGEIRTREFAFHFNPTGEIRYMRGLTRSWPHPWEWLKRSWGNDWIYYSVGLDRGQGRVKDWVGEDYLPCLSYESNAIREATPYTEPGVSTAFSAWSQVYANICCASLVGLPLDIQRFLGDVIRSNDDNALIAQARELHGIIGGRVSVLPPDTRHSDYEVIPVNIADGCLYKCRFCTVKSRAKFAPKTKEAIADQIEALKAFYGPNLQNLNAIFVGDHDALAAGGDLVAYAAEAAYTAFGFSRPQGGSPSLYLFGSCASFSKADDATFAALSALPYKVYINLGLESADDATLNQLGKPITSAMVKETLLKMVDINARYASIEVTANFLLGTTFSQDHHTAIMKLLSSLPKEAGNKGCVYLSPLVETQRREEVLPMFHEIKRHSVLSAYVYLIQRL
ncbi:hypothetical protein DSLASN_34470 [Desulfoluna limicola]|uniref:Radical SAM core domain-containing protein n=2 Tax=Desulfoluna limicola TaxID=2810562 RepID=A0ABM7PL58_9BACT|nr:hypothetical protein DSLASN_34470 [Desulfoluna limicola]